MREALALLRKEWLSESRAAAGLYSVGLYSLCALFAVAFAVSLSLDVTPGIAAGLLVVALLFAALVALPRSVLSEDEMGTFDLLRLMASAQAVFLGKLAYASLLMLLTAALFGVLFPVLVDAPVADPLLYAAALGCEALALAAGVTLCSALAVGSRFRWTLSTVLALPLLLPQLALGVGALAVAFGQRGTVAGWQNVVGLLGFTVAMMAGGPLIVALVWRSD